MKQVNRLELEIMIVRAFEAQYNKYKKDYTYDEYIRLITLGDDFSDMIRKYSTFIGYLLGRFNADVDYYDPTDKIKKLLLESDEVMLLIYVFGGDNDAYFSLKNKNIELVK
jgi:hypothetical protein